MTEVIDLEYADVVEVKRDRRALGAVAVGAVALLAWGVVTLWPRPADTQPEISVADRLAAAGIAVETTGPLPDSFADDLLAIVFPGQSALALVAPDGNVRYVDGPTAAAQVFNAPSATTHDGELIWFSEGRGFALDVESGATETFAAPADPVSAMRVDREEGGVWFNVEGELWWWDTAENRTRAQIDTGRERRHLVGVTAAGPLTHEWLGGDQFVVTAFGRDGDELWTRESARVAAISSDLVGLWTHRRSTPVTLEFVDPFSGDTERTATDLGGSGLTGHASLSANGAIASVTFNLGGFSGHRMVDATTGEPLDSAPLVTRQVGRPQFTTDGSWLVYPITDRFGATTRLDARQSTDPDPIELPVLITHQEDRGPRIFVIAA